MAKHRASFASRPMFFFSLPRKSGLILKTAECWFRNTRGYGRYICHNCTVKKKEPDTEPRHKQNPVLLRIVRDTDSAVRYLNGSIVESGAD